MDEDKLYIITQNRDYFLSHNKEFITLKNSSVKKIAKKIKKDNSIINIFLYDDDKNKLYGYYEIDFNNKKQADENYTNISINDNYKRRRGIYYRLEDKYSDFSIYEIDNKTFSKLKDRLIVLNDNISQTFLSCSIDIDKNTFKYQAVETYPSLYVAEYEKHFDNKAYESIYKEYIRLLKYSNSENNNIDRYIELGSYLMNMLIPEKDFREHLLDGFRIVYLHLDEETYNIPWDILAYEGKFISENIIFSYANASNMLYHNKRINNAKIKMAVISIPNDDIVYDKNEIDNILSLQNNIKNAEIDLYRKEHNYFEFIKILESYDIIHIITHGYSSGIKLSEDYILNSVSALEKPPKVIFINACNMEEADNKLTKSLLSSGVATVISAVGSLGDGMYMDFVSSFYNNLFHKHARINTAQAYYFAYVEVREFYKGFIRYRFNGVPVYV
ncbi:CHAT domain-containing protein [uncultured Brachyspira sp.]|uniref:CHAT domain-containing protein n=1 Tax=uncultured Brachyspira sp. TaxID=221953 RepID=UPI00260850B3|nr:CHAT domain-containing protein [uncultured Brachyspira sp.]